MFNIKIFIYIVSCLNFIILYKLLDSFKMNQTVNFKTRHGTGDLRPDIIALALFYDVFACQSGMNGVDSSHSNIFYTFKEVNGSPTLWFWLIFTVRRGILIPIGRGGSLFFLY